MKLTHYEMIPSIPEIKLTVNDMKKDPMNLILELQARYSEFGAVKLIAPPEWNPPNCFKYTKIGITTRLQPIHNLKFGKVRLH